MLDFIRALPLLSCPLSSLLVSLTVAPQLQAPDRSQWALPDLNCKSRSQWALPDPNGKYEIAAGTNCKCQISLFHVKVGNEQSNRVTQTLLPSPFFECHVDALTVGPTGARRDVSQLADYVSEVTVAKQQRLGYLQLPGWQAPPGLWSCGLCLVGCVLRLCVCACSCW